MLPLSDDRPPQAISSTHGSAATQAVTAPPGQPVAQFDELERLARPLPPPRTLIGRVKRRLLRFELEHQRLFDTEVLSALRTVAALCEERQPALARELGMTRAGLYEQGNRISLIAAQLRKEVTATHAERTSDAPR